MTDLDTALRDMFRTRAGDITELPTALIRPEADPTAPRGDDRRRGPVRAPWLIAAAVVAVLAVVGGALALARHTGGHRPAAPSPAPPTTAAPSPGPVTTARATCAVAEPADWKAAFAATVDFGARTSTALASDGSTLVVSRDFGTRRDVAIVTRGLAPRPVYVVPDPDVNQVLSATLEGHTLLVAVSRLPRDANGVIPSIQRLLVIDLRTDRATTVTAAPLVEIGGVQQRTIDGATLFHGQVYWNETATYISTTATVHAWSLTTHRQTVVATRPASRDRGPSVGARGLFLSPDDTAPFIATRLPGPVAAGLTSSLARRTLVTDGTAYAWSSPGDEIGYWNPGSRTATLYRTGARSVTVRGVAGRVVAFDNDTLGSLTGLLDTRVAAATTDASLGYLRFGSAGRFLGDRAGAAEHTVDVDTSGLPILRC